MDIVRALFRSGLEPVEVLRAYDIFPQLADLGPEVAALVYRSRRGRLYILVNERRGVVDQARSFLHELHHSVVDLPGLGCIVGLDMRDHRREAEAETFARKALSTVEGQERSCRAIPYCVF